MSRVEYLAWLELESVQPIGDRQAHIMIAQLCSIVAAIAGTKIEPAKFLPAVPKDGPSDAELEARINAYFSGRMRE